MIVMVIMVIRVPWGHQGHQSHHWRYSCDPMQRKNYIERLNAQNLKKWPPAGYILAHHHVAT